MANSLELGDSQISLFKAFLKAYPPNLPELQEEAKNTAMKNSRNGERACSVQRSWKVLAAVPG